MKKCNYCGEYKETTKLRYEYSVTKMQYIQVRICSDCAKKQSKSI